MLFKRSAECNSGSRVLQDWNFRHQIQIKVQYLILIVCRPFSILKLLSNYPVKSAEVQKKVKAFKVFHSFKELQTYCHLISKSKEQKTKKNFLKSKRTLIFPYQVPDVSLIVRVPIALFSMVQRELTTLEISANTDIPVRQRGRMGEPG